MSVVVCLIAILLAVAGCVDSEKQNDESSISSQSVPSRESTIIETARAFPQRTVLLDSQRATLEKLWTLQSGTSTGFAGALNWGRVLRDSTLAFVDASSHKLLIISINGKILSHFRLRREKREARSGKLLESIGYLGTFTFGDTIASVYESTSVASELLIDLRTKESDTLTASFSYPESTRNVRVLTAPSPRSLVVSTSGSLLDGREFRDVGTIANDEASVLSTMRFVSSGPLEGEYRTIPSAFAPPLVVAASANQLYVARDTSPLIEVFSFEGNPIGALRLAISPLKMTAELRNRWIETRRQRVAPWKRATWDSAQRVRAASAVLPAIRALVASPRGDLLVLRNDLGWQRQGEPERRVFEFFNHRLEYAGQFSLPSDEGIALFAPPYVCTSWQTGQPFSESVHTARDTRVFLSCYRIKTTRS